MRNWRNLSDFILGCDCGRRSSSCGSWRQFEYMNMERGRLPIQRNKQTNGMCQFLIYVSFKQLLSDECILDTVSHESFWYEFLLRTTSSCTCKLISDLLIISGGLWRHPEWLYNFNTTTSGMTGICRGPGAFPANIIYIGYKFITTNVWLSIIRNLFSSKAPLIYYLASTKWTSSHHRVTAALNIRGKSSSAWLAGLAWPGQK